MLSLLIWEISNQVCHISWKSVNGLIPASGLNLRISTTVRLIEKLKKHDCVSDYRKQLHWLPIPARIQFKLMATTWKALNDQAPKYIKQLLHKKPQQKHNLRSNSKPQLSEPVSQNKNNFEDRAFSFVAPKLWNSLPNNARNTVSLDTFAKSLKTHLFQKFCQSE